MSTSIDTQTEKRKLPRFHITPCQFRSDQNINYSIQDVSLGGLSLQLLDRENLIDFAVGTTHLGVMKVEGVVNECQFKVKYIRGLHIGAEWISPSAALIQHLTKILSPKNLGESLKSFPVPDFPNLVWHHTPVGVDLLLYKSADSTAHSALSRWILYFHQTFLQWEADSGIKTGQALAEDNEGTANGIVRLETRLLEFDERQDHRLLETARDFISHATSLEDTVRAMMKRQIEGVL